MKRVIAFVCVLVLTLCIVLPVAAASPSWSCGGPYGGRMLALALSPEYASDQTLFAGAEGGGLYRSTDGAQSWEAVEGLASDLTISSIVISPDYANDHTLLVASTQGGIFQSWDGGASWRWWSDGLASLSVAQLAISPRFDIDQTLVAATDRGLYLSTTAGKLWEPVGPSLGALSVAAVLGDGGGLRLYGGTIIGLYVSRDGGHVWEATGLSSAPVISIAASPGYGSDGHLLVGTLGGLYFSPDWAATWQGPMLPESVVHQVLFSQRYGSGGRWFVGVDGGCVVSDDGGATWESLASIPETVRSLVSGAGAPDAMFAGLDSRGVFGSSDGGATWSAMTEGITGVAIDVVRASPGVASDATLLAGGSQGVWRSRDDGQSWHRTGLDDAAVSDIEWLPETSGLGRALAATRAGVYCSGTDGRRWYSVQGDLPTLSVQDLAIAEDGRWWAATSDAGIYVSIGDGTWHARSAGLGSLNVTAVQAMGMGAGGEHLLAATWGQGVWYSQDDGLSWTRVAKGPQAPHLNALDAASGYGSVFWTFAATSTGLYRSGDGGQNWDDAGLFGLDIKTVALHPEYATRPNCYAGGTRDGAFFSTNGGLTWQSLNHGLGNREVAGLDVVMGADGVELLAATAGGVWRYGGDFAVASEPEGVDLLLPFIGRNYASTSMTALGLQSVEEQGPVRKGR